MSRIEFNDTMTLAKMNSSYFNDWSNASAALRLRMQTFVESIDMKGQTAQNMGAYFTEVHGAILYAWQDCIAYYRMVLDKYNRELLDVDPNTMAVIEEIYVDEFASGLLNFKNSLLDTDDSTNAFYSAFGDHLMSPRPATTTLIDTAERMISDAVAQMDRMGQLDFRFYSSAYAEVERILDVIKKACATGLLCADSGTIYTSGLFNTEGFADGLRLSEGAIDRMVEGFFIGYCSENGINSNAINSVADLIARPPNGLTDFELQVLLRLMEDTRMTYYNIIEVYYRASFSPQMGMNAEINLGRLSEKFSNRFFGLYDDFAFGRPGHLGEDALAEQLRRAQLLTFVVGVGRAVDPRSYDFSQFAQPDGVIILNGESWRVSTLRCLIDGIYLETSHRQTAELTLAEIEMFNSLWETHGISLVWKGAGFIPVIGKGVSAVDGFMSLRDAMETLRQRGVVLSNAEIAFIESMNTYSVRRFGGSVASVNTPNGYRQVGTTLARPRAQLNVAGLQAQGISLEEAMAALLDRNHPHRATVRDFVPENSNPRGAFEDALGITFRDNFSNIYEQFGVSYPGIIHRDRPVANLPVAVINEVINLHRGG